MCLRLHKTPSRRKSVHLLSSPLNSRDAPCAWSCSKFKEMKTMSKEMKIMSRSWWMLIVTIVIGLTAFVVGPHIWPMAPDVPMPPANLLPGYIVLSAIEALAFGFAVAFALFGWPAIRGLAQQMVVRHSLLVHGQLVDARQPAHAQWYEHASLALH